MPEYSLVDTDLPARVVAQSASSDPKIPDTVYLPPPARRARPPYLLTNLLTYLYTHTYTIADTTGGTATTS